MKFAQVFAAAALAHLAVLWALGDARLAAALQSLSSARESFADDWDESARVRDPPPPRTARAVAESLPPAPRGDAPGASLTTRDWRQARATWLAPPREPRRAPPPEVRGRDAPEPAPVGAGYLVTTW